MIYVQSYSMILDLREFEEFPATKLIQAGPAQIKPFSNSVIEVEGVEAELAIQKSGLEYFCQGEVTARLVLECARCLGRYTSVLSGRTDFVICSDASGPEHEKTEDTEDYLYFKGNDLRVDITEPVRQTLALGMSLKPLCSEDCKGLCPSCGTNLNERSCKCKQERNDPRWEGLRDLFPKPPEQ